MPLLPFTLWPWRPLRSATHHRRLAAEATLGLRPGREPRLTLRCGRVWVTQEGDVRDHLLNGGETLRLRRRGRVAVHAFSGADLDLTDLAEDGATFGRADPHSGLLHFRGATCWYISIR